MPRPSPPPAAPSLCATWAASGECAANPSYMKEQCRGVCECEAWAASGECAANPGWMLEQCAAACARHAPPPPRSPPSPSPPPLPPMPCDDWAIAGECNSNPGWMRLHCQTACAAVAASPPCERWAEEGECELNPAYMAQSCGEACACEAHARGGGCGGRGAGVSGCERWCARWRRRPCSARACAGLPEEPCAAALPAGEVGQGEAGLGNLSNVVVHAAVPLDLAFLNRGATPARLTYVEPRGNEVWNAAEPSHAAHARRSTAPSLHSPFYRVTSLRMPPSLSLRQMGYGALLPSARLVLPTYVGHTWRARPLGPEHSLDAGPVCRIPAHHVQPPRMQPSSCNRQHR